MNPYVALGDHPERIGQESSELQQRRREIDAEIAAEIACGGVVPPGAKTMLPGEIAVPLSAADDNKPVPGYEPLANVLQRAYAQASKGKGKERHAGGLPFAQQPILTIPRQHDSIDGALYQAAKKAGEARTLPTRQRAVTELLGAINYLAAAVILIEEGVDLAKWPVRLEPDE